MKCYALFPVAIPGFLALVLAALAGPARADDEAESIRKTLKALDTCVFKVWYRQKTTQSRFINILEDDAGGSRSDVNEQVCMGMAVDASGLILVGGHIFPDPYDRSVNAGIISMTRERSQPRDFRVEVGETKLPAELIVHDKDLNVALVRIRSEKALNLPVIRFEESAALSLADRFHVMTMLSEKYEFQKSFRSGRVRAVVGKKKKRYLQNAVSGFSGINMGREQILGGPVFDSRGRVVGIMGLEPAKPPKEKRTTGLNARSVANRVFISSLRAQTPLIIRAEELLPFIQNPLRNEQAKGWLGFQELQTLTWSMRRHLGMRKGKGMLISLVGHDSPGLEAGIRAGDLLLRIGDLVVVGKNEEDLRGLRRHIRNLPIGEAVEVEVKRGDEARVVQVTPRTRPRNVYEAETFESEALGIGVKEITYDTIERKNLDPEDLGRVLVNKVPYGGLFSLAGARTGEMVRVGDIILSVDGKVVKSVEDFKKTFQALEADKAKHALVKVKRHADTRFLKVKLDWKST